MGFGVVEDRFRRPAGGEDLEDLVDPRIADPGVEFAVGVGAGASFAEEQIALGVEGVAAEESIPFPRALGDVGATLDDYRGETRLDEPPGGKETGGTAANDDRRWTTGCGGRAHFNPRSRNKGFHRWRFAAEKIGLEPGIEIEGDGVEEPRLALAAGVEGFPDDDLHHQRTGVNAERPGCGRRQIVLVTIEGQGEVAEENCHGRWWFTVSATRIPGFTSQIPVGRVRRRS